MFEEAKALPDMILPASYSRGRRHIEPVGVKISIHETGRKIKSLKVQIDSESGPIDPIEFFDWLVGKNAFTVCEGRGELDPLFRIMDVNQLMSLARQGKTRYKDMDISVYGREGTISVRKGNKWGRLNNAIRLCETLELEDPEDYRKVVQLATLKFLHYGYRDVSLRSVGQTIQDIVLKELKPQELPSISHLYKHLQSFKAGRMEGVVFGESDCYDYDITSAYPSMIAGLCSTSNMRWVDSTDIIDDSFYAAIRCDVHINETLVRGPIGVRYGQRSTYFPVGLLPGAWLNKPDIDLLLQNPHLGKILKIHEGSWGIPSIESYPFRRTMRKLYNMRMNDAFLSRFLKYAMAALWGKFISTYRIYDDDGLLIRTQAPCLYNPIFASHVTSNMRCDLYRRSLSGTVVGEFIDGLTTTGEMNQTKGFGGFEEQGRGTIVLFSDQYKGSDWKNRDLVGIAASNPDATHLEMPRSFRHTLTTAYQKYGPSKFRDFIGRRVEGLARVPLGSTSRFIPKQLSGDLRVGDFLGNNFQSLPPHYSDVRALRLLRFTDLDRDELGLGDLSL